MPPVLKNSFIAFLRRHFDPSGKKKVQGYCMLSAEKSAGFKINIDIFQHHLKIKRISDDFFFVFEINIKCCLAITSGSCNIIHGGVFNSLCPKQLLCYSGYILSMYTR